MKHKSGVILIAILTLAAIGIIYFLMIQFKGVNQTGTIDDNQPAGFSNGSTGVNSDPNSKSISLFGKAMGTIDSLIQVSVATTSGQNEVEGVILVNPNKCSIKPNVFYSLVVKDSGKSYYDCISARTGIID